MYAQPLELRLAMERLAGEGGCDPHSAFRNMDVTLELGGPRESRSAILMLMRLREPGVPVACALTTRAHHHHRGFVHRRSWVAGFGMGSRPKLRDGTWVPVGRLLRVGCAKNICRLRQQVFNRDINVTLTERRQEGTSEALDVHDGRTVTVAPAWMMRCGSKLGSYIRAHSGSGRSTAAVRAICHLLCLLCPLGGARGAYVEICSGAVTGGKGLNRVISNST